MNGRITMEQLAIDLILSLISYLHGVPLDIGLIEITDKIIVKLGHVHLLAHQQPFIDAVDVGEGLEAARAPPVDVFGEI